MMKTGMGMALIVILLSSQPSMAHEKDVLFNRKVPVPVVVKFKKIVHVKLWEQVLKVNTTIPETSLNITIDEHFPNMLVLTNVAKKTAGMIYATTVSGVVVNMRIRHWGETYQVVTVTDARTEAERALDRLNEKSKLSPEERAVRQLWRAQWGFPADEMVQITQMNHLAERNDLREVLIIKRYETVGFYGFTQKLTNRRSVAMALHPSTVRFDCPLFSVGLGGHAPALGPHGNPHVIKPGGSVLVHLTCKGARRAAIP